MNIIKNYGKDLKKEFSGYNGKKFSKDLLSGVTVAAVALPLALAFGVSSGATAAAGLITAIIAGVLIGALSGASFQISGPTGAMAALLCTLAAKYGMDGIFIACLLAGILLLICGIMKLGKVISLIPSSVITGFTSGIAIIIAFGQIDNFFGVKGQGDIIITKISSYFKLGFHPNWEAVLIGSLVILIMVFWPKKLNAVFPSSLLALVVVIVFNSFMNFNVDLVGEIPKSLMLEERLSIGTIKLSEINSFIVPAISIAALCMVESLLCGTVGSKMKKERLDGDRELIAQGVGNIVLPFFGGIPATAAIARTSVVIKAGSVTRIAGVTHACVLLLSMFILSPIMSKIPLSALAGVLMVTAFRMNDWENIRFIFSHKFKSGIAKFLITMIATATLDLTQAIVIGILLSSVLMLVRITNIDVTISNIDAKRLEEIGIKLPKTKKKVKIAYLTGNIFFAVTGKITGVIEDMEATDILIISMRGVPTIDLSGVQAMCEIVSSLKEKGTRVMITSIQPKVLEDLSRGDFLNLVNKEDIFNRGEDAIVKAYKVK